MSELVIASNEADAHAAEAVKQHHAALAGALSLRTEALLRLPPTRHSAAEQARRDLVDWCERELVPHAAGRGAGDVPGRAGHRRGRLLIDAMLGEHEVLTRCCATWPTRADLLRAAASAAALRAVFDSHLTKENDLVVPLLAATSGVSLAELLGGMHQLLGDAGETAVSDADEAWLPAAVATPAGAVRSTARGIPSWTCGPIPHAIRHATIFGALDSVLPGAGLDLVAPHDPLPLLDQVDQRWPGASRSPTASGAPRHGA